MRSGTNPTKHAATLPPYKRHRIVMAVYIPSQEGYFASALEIFRMSLASLFATVDPEHVSITMIDNASIREVREILDEALQQGLIDRIVCNARNRGKPDAVIAEMRSSFERYVTIVDSDVLFLPGWLKRVEEIYLTWPEASAVSPAAQPKAAYYQNASTWLFGVSRAALRLGKFSNDEDLSAFAQSVGQAETFYKDYERASQYVIQRRGSYALVGAGHFVMTVRAALYRAIEIAPSLGAYGGEGMRDIDRIVDRSGGLRLSTTRSCVLHMGNTVEDWMPAKLGQILQESKQPLSPSGCDLDRGRRHSTLLPYWVVRIIAFPIMRIARLLHIRRCAQRGSAA